MDTGTVQQEISRSPLLQRWETWNEAVQPLVSRLMRGSGSFDGTHEQQRLAAFHRYRAEIVIRLRELDHELSTLREFLANERERQDRRTFSEAGKTRSTAVIESVDTAPSEARIDTLMAHRIALLGERDRVDAEIVILQGRGG